MQTTRFEVASLQRKGEDILRGRYTLLLNYFITFFGCKMQVIGFTYSIYKPLMCRAVLFLSKFPLKLHVKY